MFLKNHLCALCMLVLTVTGCSYNSSNQTPETQKQVEKRQMTQLNWSSNLTQDHRSCGKYVSGKELAENNKELWDYESGAFIEVPKKYEDPNGEKTQVYAYFAKKYDPEKPTYVFFLGGPGQHSHQHLNPKFNFYTTLGYNFLLLDQRGIAFSRFSTQEDAKNTQNYSSIYTAKDMLAAIDHFGIKKVSVYGASYGTIPATIFASLFPERTTSVVLEGVVHDGDKLIYQDTHRVKIIQRYYNSLPQDLKNKIQELVDTKVMDQYNIPGTIMAILMMYGEDRLQFWTEVMKLALLERKGTSSKDLSLAWTDLAKKENPTTSYYTLTNLPKMSQEECYRIQDSDDVNQILMIKEFGAAEQTSYTSVYLNNGKIEPLPNSGYIRSDSYTNWPITLEKYYSAKNYPVKVPLFYLQGTYDGATPVTGAIKHFKEVPTSTSQLFLFDGGPHMPTGKIINDMTDEEKEWGTLQSMFKTLLDGNTISCEGVNDLNKKYSKARVSSAGKNGAMNCKYIKN